MTVLNFKNLKKSRLLCPEHKSVHWILDELRKFSRHGALVVDIFRGKVATAKVCLITLQHRCFVGCGTDQDCFKGSGVGLVETYAALYVVISVVIRVQLFEQGHFSIS